MSGPTLKVLKSGGECGAVWLEMQSGAARILEQLKKHGFTALRCVADGEIVVSVYLEKALPAYPAARGAGCALESKGRSNQVDRCPHYPDFAQPELNMEKMEIINLYPYRSPYNADAMMH